MSILLTYATLTNNPKISAVYTTKIHFLLPLRVLQWLVPPLLHIFSILGPWTKEQPQSGTYCSLGREKGGMTQFHHGGSHHGPTVNTSLSKTSHMVKLDINRAGTTSLSRKGRKLLEITLSLEKLPENIYPNNRSFNYLLHRAIDLSTGQIACLLPSDFPHQHIRNMGYTQSKREKLIAGKFLFTNETRVWGKCQEKKKGRIIN